MFPVLVKQHHPYIYKRTPIIRSTPILSLRFNMASNALILLSFLLVFGQQSWAKGSHSSSSESEEHNVINQKTCNVAPYDRRDCGYPGISASECAQRKCCFDSSIPGVNWCFFSKTQDKAQCGIKTKDRKDCGFPGISAKDCYSRGCCFDDSKPEVKWCFYPKFKGCSVSHKLRKDCGYPNISVKDCHSRGCCYDSSIPETVWCFYGYK
ncbi:trefoil factor 2-like isoform X1 [Hyla sarda]|uniref:trefoil factor 2-like isoform X1 n=1 Tax=Hyla sarda TaxID=327740 RepID=UPI0024C26A8E|nr:trefoil factor 2-like isoform X1 [Hyla sarda]